MKNFLRKNLGDVLAVTAGILLIAYAVALYAMVVL